MDPGAKCFGQAYYVEPETIMSRFLPRLSFLVSLAFCVVSAVRSEEPERLRGQGQSLWGAAGFSVRFTASAAPDAARQAADHVFPEDGSLPMRTWYHGSLFGTGRPSDQAVAAALAAEGVRMQSLGFDYAYAQDIALFSRGGSLLLNADMPADGDILSGLTRGVGNIDDGEMNVTRLEAGHAARLGLPQRSMKWTFLEGGEMVSGRYADGRPYAILSQNIIRRAQGFYKLQTGKVLDEKSALILVGADLGISPEDLFPVTAGKHLDLVLQALPGGVILLSDPGQTVPTIERILAGNIPEDERLRLLAMRELYINGYQNRYSKSAPEDIRGKPLGPVQMPDNDDSLRLLSAISRSLASRLRVVRVAGVFKEALPYANNPPDASGLYIADEIDFFNGFVGRGPGGNLFVITNQARGLSALQSYWRDALAARGVAPERVHFVGDYSHGAGIDCEGAGSPQ